MMDIQVAGRIRKLYSRNYDIWQTCMKSYLQGEDLWEVVAGSETTPPPAVEAEALREWNIKAGKAMFAIMTTVEDGMLELIRKASSPKEAWDTFATFFSKKNERRLQLLENELLSVKQGDMTINQYFSKVKTLCSEISELDLDSKISDQRMQRIIIHGLRPEYRGFIAAIQNWPTQPSLLQLENLLAHQETLARQMAQVLVKSEKQKKCKKL